MKKYQLLILLLNFFCTSILAQESGWEILGNIKYQKKKLNNLIDVCVSSDSNFLYTVNQSNKVKDTTFFSIHKWDYNSGEYIDTIEANSYIPIKFTSDGKYLLMVSRTFYMSGVFETDIYIYDIALKRIVKKIPYSFGNPNSEYMYHSTVVFDKFDYDDYREQLYLSAFIYAYDYISLGGYSTRISYYQGHSRLFKVEQNKLNLLQNYSNDRTFSKITVNDVDYIASSISQTSNSSTGSAYSTQIKYTNFIKSLSNSQFNTLIKTDYVFNEDYGSGKPYSSWSKGDSNTFRHLAFNKDLDKLISTCGKKLLYFNLGFNNLVDTFLTDKMFNLASFCNDGRYVLNIFKDSLIITNTTNKSVEEIIKLPFSPQKIKLLKNEAKLLVFEDSGNVAIVELPKCYNVSNVSELCLNKLINRYNSYHIDFNTKHVSNLSDSVVEIIDILGRNIQSIGVNDLINNPIIDISNLNYGIYFLKYNNLVEKFMKF